MTFHDPLKGLDPRLYPYRADLAAQDLEGVVEASRFVAGELYEVRDEVAPLRRSPSPEVYLDTQALYGERVRVYEITEEGWAWGQIEQDHYVGYLPANALMIAGPAPTHKVRVPRSFIFPGPHIKLTPRLAISMGAQVHVSDFEGDFARCRDGWIFASHLAPLDVFEKDFVDVARQFLEVPYLWGGKSSAGIDCSGLVQVALAACGIACPRDSDMQEQAAGRIVEDDLLECGDLIFWKGHVGLVSGANILLHANAHHMRVAEESLSGAIARISDKGLPVRTRRRM